MKVIQRLFTIENIEYKIKRLVNRCARLDAYAMACGSIVASGGLAASLVPMFVATMASKYCQQNSGTVLKAVKSCVCSLAQNKITPS